MPVTISPWTFIEVTCYILLFFVMIPVKINDGKYDTIKKFEKYLKDFNKTYLNVDIYNAKLKAFENSLKIIEELNRNQPNQSAKYGLTKFSDLTQEEFKNTRLTELSLSKSPEIYPQQNHITKRSLLAGLPKKIDWRQKNAVTKIKSQKDCGACWAFSVIETIESMQAIKKNVLEELSVQEMIDCSVNNGCDGGDICTLLAWLKTENITVVPNKVYPFVRAKQTCTLDTESQGVRVGDFSCDRFVGDEHLLLDTLANHGPVAVAINGEVWQNYVGGVIQFHCSDRKEDLNHAVQIVGYDLGGDVPYYIVRNSWGEDFGDKGYLYVAVGGNVCGVAMEVSMVSIL